MGVNDMVAVAAPFVRNQPIGVLGTTITIGNILQVFYTVFAGGTLGVLLRVMVMWKRAKDEGTLAFRKLESDDEDKFRSTLLARIATLEKNEADLRLQLLDQIRKCDEEQRVLRSQIDGLTRQLVAFQVASGHPISLSAETRAAGERALKAMDDRAEGTP